MFWFTVKKTFFDFWDNMLTMVLLNVGFLILVALLLAGPALSLPNMLVIRGILGTQKTVVYCSLVVVMATITGMVFGAFYP